MAIDDQNLAVIAVIELDRDKGLNGTERVSFDAFFPELFIVIFRECRKGAKIIIDEADIHPFLHFLKEY